MGVDLMERLAVLVHERKAKGVVVNHTAPPAVAAALTALPTTRHQG